MTGVVLINCILSEPHGKTVAQSEHKIQADMKKPAVYAGLGLEARVGIEPTHKGFADLSLTTWVPRPLLQKELSTRSHCTGNGLGASTLDNLGTIRQNLVTEALLTVHLAE